MDIATLKKNLDGAHSEFVSANAKMCEKLHSEGDFLSQDELLHFISNETAKCLADYKNAIIEALNPD